MVRRMGKRCWQESYGTITRRKIIQCRTVWRCGDCPNCPKKCFIDRERRVRMKCPVYGIEIEHPISGGIPQGCRLKNAEGREGSDTYSDAIQD